MTRVLRHVRSNLVAYLALFVALGGTSYAAVNLPRNSVGTAQLKPSAVTSAKVKNGSLLAADFRRGQLRAGPQGAAGPAGPAGERGAAGERGPSEAYSVIGPSPVIVGPTAVEVAGVNVPAGAYTLSATGFIYGTGEAAQGTRDQYVCFVLDAADTVLANMPSQVTLDAPQQFLVIGAGQAAAGRLRLMCRQIVQDGAEGAFTELGARLVATRVGSLTKP
ncbi:MAG: hypothetical protein MUF56_03775 [Solirubrobacteraceae bacterium]|jgi:hypothetical protein|nr:hypothetical protein [Solirubrobacteraceae bacterium]